MAVTSRGSSLLLFSVFLLLVAALNAVGDRLPPPFLKEVVRRVAAKERWVADSVRAARVDDEKVEVGSSRMYEFHVHATGRVLVFKVSGGIGSWKGMKGKGAWGEMLGSELLSRGARRRRVLGSFQLEGPLELRAAGEGGMSVLLPRNSTYTGIKRAIVGEGIKVKIKGAFEVSIVVPNDLRFLVNRSLIASNEYKHPLLLPQEYPSRRQLLQVDVHGLVSVTASKIGNPGASIQAAFHSSDTLELLPDKCFRTGYFRRRPPIDVLSLASRAAVVEKILRSFLSSMMAEIPHFVKVKIASVNWVKFLMEVKREIDEEDSVWKSIPPWKTKLPVERAHFEVIARVDESKQLHYVSTRRLKKPFVVAETVSWSSLLSNLSFSRLLSGVALPEPLTLDAKW